ncbi:MAG: 2-oxopent-4-enoate hydratase [Cycloclasticus sp.]|nr:2-oxopent-4-enoate hydratase [Cycloclasticus sp. 44_32_T64]
MDQDKIIQYGDELYNALITRQTIAPITERSPEVTIEDAYAIQNQMISRRIEAGESIVGKKVGCTSQVVMDMLNVNQPDFGYLLTDMVYSEGQDIPISETMIQPKAEGEIAFVLKKDLCGPGLTNADILAATEAVMPCFEIVDSRIKDWKIKIQDTVADNASCGYLVLGGTAVDPRKVDLSVCGLTLEKNGELMYTGAGAAALGSPVNAMTWLANTMGALGVTLKAGEVILSGALCMMVDAKAGDSMRVSVGGIGSASVRFV